MTTLLQQLITSITRLKLKKISVKAENEKTGPYLIDKWKIGR